MFTEQIYVSGIVKYIIYSLQELLLLIYIWEI